MGTPNSAKRWLLGTVFVMALSFGLGAQAHTLCEEKLLTNLAEPAEVSVEELRRLVETLRALNKNSVILDGEVEVKTQILQNYLKASLKVSTKDEKAIELLQDLLFESTQKLDLGDLRAANRSDAAKAVAKIIDSFAHEQAGQKHFGPDDSFALFVALVAGMSAETIRAATFVDQVIIPLKLDRKAFRGNWANSGTTKYIYRLNHKLNLIDYKRFSFYTSS